MRVNNNFQFMFCLHYYCRHRNYYALSLLNLANTRHGTCQVTNII